VRSYEVITSMSDSPAMVEMALGRTPLGRPEKSPPDTYLRTSRVFACVFKHESECEHVRQCQWKHEGALERDVRDEPHALPHLAARVAFAQEKQVSTQIYNVHNHGNPTGQLMSPPDTYDPSSLNLVILFESMLATSSLPPKYASPWGVFRSLPVSP
jgi:hypothetical protein